MPQFLFKLPDVGEGTAEAELVAWHVKLGDVVEEDQPLADVMTDKATVELTSPVAGRVAELRGKLGELCAVKSVLVVLDTEAAGEVEAAVGEPLVSEPVASPEPDPRAATARIDAKPLAAPAVRQRAKDEGIALGAVDGSGPDGRVIQADLDTAIAAHASQPTRSATPAPRVGGADRVEEVRIIGLRRKIAQQMQESKRRIPHFAYVEEIDVTALEDLRAHLNATRRVDQPKLTLLPFLIRALCRAVPGWPSINARFDDEEGVLRRQSAVHLGIATQTPGGLVVPVIRDAGTHDLWALAREIARLAQAVRDGTAAKEELSGSTLTLTSLGTLGGVAHTPVINHPETAIVGPNRIVERPVVRDGAIVVRKMMNLSSSFDHRVVDGYDAAQFIQKIKSLLEYPATLFMD